MMTSRALLTLVMGSLLVGCNTTSHIVVGQKRTPTNPDKVKVYIEPPAEKYDRIALLDADSNGSFRITNQGKMDAAVQRLKVGAAKLGANGVILQARGESGAVMFGNSFGQTTGNLYSGSNFGVASGGLIRTVSGIAIWVDE